MKQITSLRGLAIILIILFHLNPEHFPYGYFGVEVFLVISGYLLMKSLQKQQMQIRLGEFARKKVLRLFTPVAVIVPLTLLAGMFFLDYTDLATASSTGGYTLIGAANRFLAVIQSDYFAQDSSGNPFLHMWYLAVTAQIYLLFAGGCVLYRYLPKRAAASLFWIAGIGSFLWAYSYPIHNLLQEIGVPVWEQVRPTSHYMTLPRLWEVCAGILLAIYPPPLSSTRCENRKKNALLFLLGILCILVPALSRGKDVSLCSAAVVLGTCLVIRYAEPGRLAHCFNNKLLLWIGGISFSLYLVHMPLIAFYHSWFLHAPGWPGMLAIGAASTVLGGLLYLTVEKKRMKMKWFIPCTFSHCFYALQEGRRKDSGTTSTRKSTPFPAPSCMAHRKSNLLKPPGDLIRKPSNSITTSLPSSANPISREVRNPACCSWVPLPKLHP
ncbi:MAG: acyltransferase family protein [Akkermansia muciniphila]